MLTMPGLLCLWDFHDEAGADRMALGPNGYGLREHGGPIARNAEGPLSGYSATLVDGQYFSIARQACPALNLRGPEAQVTVVAWIKRGGRPEEGCEAVAGLWNETHAKRQYCLFLDLRIHDSRDQVCGHVSNVGGPTPGHKWCMDASIGETKVPLDVWQCVGFTYDSKIVKSYLNGQHDARPGLSPYAYPGGLFDGGTDGSDFTVGAVHRSGEMGNFYEGALGGLAVFDRALSANEMDLLYKGAK